MRTFCVEIRDSGTFIPAMVTVLKSSNFSNRYLLKRAGFPVHPLLVLVTELATGESHWDYYDWGQQTRTMIVAHKFIEKNYQDLQAGSVVDVEFILGMTDAPKISERLEGSYEPTA